MSETEIEPLRALVHRVMYIIKLLLPSQFRPNLLAALVPPDVVILHGNKQEYIDAANREQNFISSLICPACQLPNLKSRWLLDGLLTKRTVIVAIDIRSDDIPCLNEHVVERRRYRPRADCI